MLSDYTTRAKKTKKKTKKKKRKEKSYSSELMICLRIIF